MIPVGGHVQADGSRHFEDVLGLVYVLVACTCIYVPFEIMVFNPTTTHSATNCGRRGQS
jgi:hypothetical protein